MFNLDWLDTTTVYKKSQVGSLNKHVQIVGFPLFIQLVIRFDLPDSVAFLAPLYIKTTLSFKVIGPNDRVSFLPNYTSG